MKRLLVAFCLAFLSITTPAIASPSLENKDKDYIAWYSDDSPKKLWFRISNTYHWNREIVTGVVIGEKDTIYFTWEGRRYMYNGPYMLEEVKK